MRGNNLPPVQVAEKNYLKSAFSFSLIVRVTYNYIVLMKFSIGEDIINN